MEAIHNHPSAEMLASYSAGSLPLSHALCVSAHLEYCPACMQSLRQLNRVGGELMQQLKPAPAAAEVKQRLLQQLDTLEPEESSPTRPPQTTAVPRALQQFVPSHYGDLKWKRISMDIQRATLCRDSNGARVELLKIRPGGSANSHTHMGDEYTVILEGAFSDEYGVYGPGDFLHRGPQHRHTPVATQDRDCICLAVTEGPVQLTGWFAPLVNPLLRLNHP